MGDFNVVL